MSSPARYTGQPRAALQASHQTQRFTYEFESPHSNRPIGILSIAPAPTSEAISEKVLWRFDKTVSQEAFAGLTIQELMLHAISQSAVATFESSSINVLARDGYNIDERGHVRSKTFVYSENLKSRGKHQASSFRTALGSVWIQKTVLVMMKGASKTHRPSRRSSFTRQGSFNFSGYAMASRPLWLLLAGTGFTIAASQ